MEEGYPWHLERSLMLKKHLFLRRALSALPAEQLVVFSDAYDILFQRPLADLCAAGRVLSGGRARPGCGGEG